MVWRCLLGGRVLGWRLFFGQRDDRLVMAVAEIRMRLSEGNRDGQPATRLAEMVARPLQLPSALDGGKPMAEYQKSLKPEGAPPLAWQQKAA